MVALPKNLMSDYSGIKSNCGLHIKRPHLEKNAKILKIKLSQFFFAFQKFRELLKQIFFSNLNLL